MKQNLVTAQAVHLPSATEAQGQLLTCIPQAQQMAAVSLLGRVRLIQIWCISCNTDSGTSAAGAGASAEGAGDSAAAQILVRLLQHRGSCIRCSTGAGATAVAQSLGHLLQHRGWDVCGSTGPGASHRLVRLLQLRGCPACHTTASQTSSPAAAPAHLL